MITAKALYASARLRSLPLSVSGVLLGSGAAYGAGVFRADIFALALLTTLLFQVLSDYANDYGDAVKGTDDDGRLGPRRAIQTGQMSAEQMRRVIVVTALLSALCSLALSVLAFGERFYLVLLFLALGGASIYAAIRYTVGADAYGYKGLGDVFVFLFFGLLSVLGSYFLYARSLDAVLLLPACACGMLSTAVLNLNNMRDVQNDALKGKRTIPVRIGLSAAKRYHYALIAGGASLMLCYSFLRGEPGVKLLYIASFMPLIWHLFFILKVRGVPRLRRTAKGRRALHVCNVGAVFHRRNFELNLNAARIKFTKCGAAAKPSCAQKHFGISSHILRQTHLCIEKFRGKLA